MLNAVALIVLLVNALQHVIMFLLNALLAVWTQWYAHTLHLK